MTTDLVTFNPDQLDLIKRTIAKDATNDELALFIHQCERTGLDPINKQIYFQKYGGKVTIITAIDGFRLIAQRTGQYGGSGGTWWCGDDGVWKEIWPEGKPPVAAKVIVKKVIGGTIVETPAVAHYAEYVVKYGSKVGDMWVKMPRNQLAKCAEALALRKAFPAELSGLYTTDEMAQAEVVVPVDTHRGSSSPRPVAAAELPSGAGAAGSRDESGDSPRTAGATASRGAQSPAPPHPVDVQTKPRPTFAAPSQSRQNSQQIMAELGETPRSEHPPFTEADETLVTTVELKALRDAIDALDVDAAMALADAWKAAKLPSVKGKKSYDKAAYEVAMGLVLDAAVAMEERRAAEAPFSDDEAVSA